MHRVAGISVPATSRKEVLMRATKDQIIQGIASYVETDVIPKLDDVGLKIVIDIAIQAMKANKKLADSILNSHPILKVMLKEDESGTFDVDEVLGYVINSMKKYGPYSIIIDKIPILSPTEKTLTFTDADVRGIKKLINKNSDDEV